MFITTGDLLLIHLCTGHVEQYFVCLILNDESCLIQGNIFQYKLSQIQEEITFINEEDEDFHRYFIPKYKIVTKLNFT